MYKAGTYKYRRYQLFIKVILSTMSGKCIILCYSMLILSEYCLTLAAFTNIYGYLLGRLDCCVQVIAYRWANIQFHKITKKADIVCYSVDSSNFLSSRELNQAWYNFPECNGIWHLFFQYRFSTDARIYVLRKGGHFEKNTCIALLIVSENKMWI